MFPKRMKPSLQRMADFGSLLPWNICLVSAAHSQVDFWLSWMSEGNTIQNFIAAAAARRQYSIFKEL